MAGTNFFMGRLWVNHVSGKGFSEDYPLNTSDRATAKLNMGTICSYRSLLLAKDCSIVFSSFSLSDSARDSGVPTAGYLTDAAALDTEGGGIADIDNLDEGVAVRFSTTTGKKSYRLFRGIRDPWCVKEKLTITPSSIGGPLSWVAPAAGFTAADALGTFLAVFLNYCTYHKKAVSPDTGYYLTDYNSYGVLGIGERQCGPGYGFARARRKATV